MSISPFIRKWQDKINAKKSGETEFDAVIIGGGPAGMMAAGRAGERGRNTLLLEKNEILGRKLLISGKGRSNITNAGDIDDYLENFGRSREFLRNAFSRFFNAGVMAFFEKRGVPLVIERGKRVFPRSGKSKDILDALRKYLNESKVNVLLKSNVTDIVISATGEKNIILADGTGYTAKSVSISTGGLSYPGTGSTGFGFEIAGKLGHTVLNPAPALVPLVTETRPLRGWQGISLRNIEASVLCGGIKKGKKFGDAIFTHFGLSGPVILDLSNEVYYLIEAKKKVYISINLKPAIDKGKLDDRLVREFSRHSARALKNVLKELLPSKMAEGFVRYCGLQPGLKANQITKEERRRIVQMLTDLRFKVKETRPIKEAIVTNGGIDTKEINPKTMESRLIKGLFFAGEVIDVDAKCGGYNMQGAFSTGYVCGDSL